MAAMTTEMNPASTFDALLVVVGVTLVVLLPVVVGEVAVGEAVPVAAKVAPLGSPKIMPSVGTGPIPADADAPIPTRPPTDCCKIQIVVRIHFISGITSTYSGGSFFRRSSLEVRKCVGSRGWWVDGANHS